LQKKSSSNTSTPDTEKQIVVEVESKPPIEESNTNISSNQENKVDSPPLSNGNNNSITINGGKSTSESMVEEEKSWYLVGESNQPTDIEIEVIRTNWLYRCQRRLFKFTDTHFIRIQPENGHYKETFQYTEVAEIDFRNSSNLIIKFNNGKESQYLNTTRASEIVDIIHRKNIGVKVLKY